MSKKCVLWIKGKGDEDHYQIEVEDFRVGDNGWITYFRSVRNVQRQCWRPSSQIVLAYIEEDI
jgi:hypothetical protein